MAAKLVAEDGLLKGLVLPLEEGNQWLIGRDPEECQLLIEDPAASRKQLVCRSTPQGIEIENLSDSNPVEVNAEKLTEPRLLHEGDLVKIGSGNFRFYMNNFPHGETMEGTEQESKTEGEEREPVATQPMADAEAALPEVSQQASPEASQESPVETAPADSLTHDLAQDLEQDLDEDKEKEDSIFEGSEAVQHSELAAIDFSVEEGGRWFIKVISGPNTGAEFAMQAGAQYIFGTDPATCDIVFHDASVSRQHARISISKEEIVTIDDLKSRNGTIVDEEKITGPKMLPSNTVVTLGTTAFVVLDREGKHDTIISPLLPSIVKVLQRDEARKAEELAAKGEPEPAPLVAAPVEEIKPPSPEKTHFHYTALILIAMVTGILVIAGIGAHTLFSTNEIEAPQVNFNDKIKEALVAFPAVKSSFNPSTGQLLLVGHVLTQVEMTQLLYNLQELNFIKNINNNVVVDEYVWQEINQVIAKNPDWRGITIHSPAAGRFVLTGYLKTRKQADQLSDYLSQNFAYLDLLEKRVVVEEDLLTQVNVDLQDEGIRGVTVQMNNGEISLSGTVGTDKAQALDKVIAKVKEIPGVRAVNNYVAQQTPELAVIDLTSQYTVTGYSNQGDVSQSVIINGKILSRGDTLDGMTITSIKPNAVFLEKDNIKYRIDYNK
jgi:type III secretion system YscD/HrpQ family protein